MRYYIAYKFAGMDKDLLRKNLEFISTEIEKTLNDSFIFCRNAQDWGNIKIPTEEIMPKAFLEIDNSDGLFIFVENGEKSEGLLLEAGYAKAKNKKIILAIKNDIDSLRFLKSISDEIIEFNNIDEFPHKIKNVLK